LSACRAVLVAGITAGLIGVFNERYKQRQNTA
jgi:hypothetical protein